MLNKIISKNNFVTVKTGPSNSPLICHYLDQTKYSEKAIKPLQASSKEKGKIIYLHLSTDCYQNIKETLKEWDHSITLPPFFISSENISLKSKGTLSLCEQKELLYYFL